MKLEFGQWVNVANLAEMHPFYTSQKPQPNPDNPDLKIRKTLKQWKMLFSIPYPPPFEGKTLKGIYLGVRIKWNLELITIYESGIGGCMQRYGSTHKRLKPNRCALIALPRSNPKLFNLSQVFPLYGEKE